ncbi:c-type cytochrome [Magnetospirillum aberrantis]|uniref:C-type cytochrome n=1 Tax=Magnetospirillum aberrantis SpK TaxID=908842 RepID=A0A7C9UTS5_9PROT|nr:cytochrome c [Magnetospirillum aberrantis]NFV79786.1 c-type cytochrome [Magnetospirillum aberrantis SpK]
MSRRRFVALSVFLAAAAVVTGGWIWLRGQVIDPDSRVQVARGAEIYVAQCAQCHGARLEGEAEWHIRKPNGELPAPPHDASGHTWHHADEYLFGVTKHGMARYAPPDYKSAMPAYVGKLSDGDIRAVIAFIKSTWPDEIRRRQEALGRR